MSDGVLIAVISAIVNIVGILIEGRKTRKANKEDNVKTKHEMTEVINAKLDESQVQGEDIRKDIRGLSNRRNNTGKGISKELSKI